MGKKSKTQKKRQKYRPQECSDNMTFQECELAILRQAVDTNEKITGQKIASSEEIVKMIEIVEEFLKNKQLLCYGGTAINNILPKHAQFYNKEYEVPDYDFYSDDALNHAKELADIYHAAGYEHVDAKSGVHAGTFKVFVNFIPMADITQMHKELFNRLSNDAISVTGIKYVPADFLRMGMYLELSRPAGDISRWEKVLKRLNLLNKFRPMKVDYDCSKVDFLRKMETDEGSEKIYEVIRDTFIDQGVVFFGGYAASLYSRQMSKKGRQFVEKIPDFDVLANNPQDCATNVVERLNDAGFKNVKTKLHPAIGEIISEHVEISMKDEILGFIYKPIACHNYNTIQIKNAEINVATIDTIMSFYLAFLFVDTGYYFHDRILCMARYLFELEQSNRLAQNGVLQRFGPKCIGHQETMENIRANKTAKFLELKQDRSSKEFQTLFLNYSPANSDKNKAEKEEKEKEEEEEEKSKKDKKTRAKKKTKKKTKKEGSPKGLKGLLKTFYSSK
jgi:hypothetical protein